MIVAVRPPRQQARLRQGVRGHPHGQRGPGTTWWRRSASSPAAAASTTPSTPSAARRRRSRSSTRSGPAAPRSSWAWRRTPPCARSPRTSWPLQEKVIKGTMYGSVRPNVDFPWLVELYLDGRLKIDELVSRHCTAGGDQRGLPRHARRPGGPRRHRLQLSAGVALRRILLRSLGRLLTRRPRPGRAAGGPGVGPGRRRRAAVAGPAPLRPRLPPARGRAAPLPPASRHRLHAPSLHPPGGRGRDLRGRARRGAAGARAVRASRRGSGQPGANDNAAAWPAPAPDPAPAAPHPARLAGAPALHRGGGAGLSGRARLRGDSARRHRGGV